MRSDARVRFDSGVILLFQSQFFAMKVTNEIVSFCIDHRLRQMAFFGFAKVGKVVAKAGFRVMLKYFEINQSCMSSNLFRYYIHKTNRFNVAVHLFSNRSKKTSKCDKNISDTLGYASCATFLTSSVIYY